MGTQEEPPEYESDPEGSSLALATRRREASDDEESGVCDDGDKPRRREIRPGIHSDGDSEGQGAPEDYDDVESEIEAGEEDVEIELDEVEGEEFGEQVGEEEELVGGIGKNRFEEALVYDERGYANELEQIQSLNQNQNHQEGKTEKEPFSVPTAGAFYMHDDRFGDNGRGRPRRFRGGHRLWESRDDRAWVHDRFEEMNLQDMHYDKDRRIRKRNFRARGRNRFSERGYVRSNRNGGYENQNHVPRGVRGRGPQRYQPQKNSIEAVSSQRKQVGRNEPSVDISSDTASAHMSSRGSEVVAAQKHGFSSSLSSASPPFYPSSTTNQDISTPKKDAESPDSAILASGTLETNSSKLQTNVPARRKSISSNVYHDETHADDAQHSATGKTLTSLQSLNQIQFPQSKVQRGRGLTLSDSMSFQLISSPNHLSKASSQLQMLDMPESTVQTPSQPSSRASMQKMSPVAGSGSQLPSLPQLPSSASPNLEIESPGSGKSKTSLVGKGKSSSIQGTGSGRPSFLYNGAQVIGAPGSVGVAQGDQNFPATPALLPVMQFGGQPHGALGVPAVGMALPGYVAQSQLGLRNSEMAWMPVLAGAPTGALGATYCSPYIAFNGGFYTRPSGPISSVGSSREAMTNKPANNFSRSPQRPELSSEEFSQRQNKPRRYSEMNFGH